jgi:hypothetical protein
MTRIEQIQQYPSSFFNPQGQKCHESLIQSHAALAYVKELLEKDTPASVVLELIEECRRVSVDSLFCCIDGIQREDKERMCPRCKAIIDMGTAEILYSQFEKPSAAA